MLQLWTLYEEMMQGAVLVKWSTTTDNSRNPQEKNLVAHPEDAPKQMTYSEQRFAKATCQHSAPSSTCVSGETDFTEMHKVLKKENKEGEDKGRLFILCNFDV